LQNEGTQVEKVADYRTEIGGGEEEEETGSEDRSGLSEPPTKLWSS